MKRFSHQVYHLRRLAVFILALSFLLLVSSLKLSVAQKASRAGWRVEVEEGKSTRSTLTINNRCSEPHLFRIKNSVKYLRFEQPTESVLIAASSNKRLGARFDAAGLKSKVYRSKVVVECLDCKKESKCTQDRDEVPIELTVIKSATPNIVTPAEPISTQAIKPSSSNMAQIQMGRIVIQWGTKRIAGCPGNGICIFKTDPGPRCPLFNFAVIPVNRRVEAIGTLEKNRIILELTSAPPERAKRISVDEDIALDDCSCRALGYSSITILKGNYKMSYTETKFGKVVLKVKSRPLSSSVQQ